MKREEEIKATKSNQQGTVCAIVTIMSSEAGNQRREVEEHHEKQQRYRTVMRLSLYD